MSDDLVKRLRKNVMCGDAVIEEAADRIEHLENRCANLLVENGILNNRIEKLEAALKNISEGDIPRKVKIPFRDDGQSSKHDRCEHGQWFYEDCGCCIEDYARKTLEGKDD